MLKHAGRSDADRGSGLHASDFGEFSRRACKVHLRSRAFTLTESMIASVVLAACVVGIGGTLGVSYRNSQSLDENAVATTLARQMLEEILSRKYVDGAGSSDSIYDYRNRIWSSAATITTSDGTVIALPSGGTYTRHSDVDYYEEIKDIDDAPETDLDPLPPIAFVTVTVTTPSSKTVQLSQLIAQK